MTVAGITYNSLHWWVRRNFGSAMECENSKCLGQSKFFVWALKKGKVYDRKRSNFFQLCRKCHLEYDMTPKWRKEFIIQGRLLANKRRLGTHHTEESKNKIKAALKSRFPNGRIAWNKGKKGCFSNETKKKMSLAKIGRVPWNKGLKTNA